MLLAGWMIHTCTRKQRVAGPATGKGDPTYGAASTFTARVEKARKLVKRADGTDVFSTHILATESNIEMTDIVWLPSIAGETADDTLYDSKGRRPISIVTATNKMGTQSLVQVYF